MVNSSTMTSEHAMYTNVPLARLLKITSSRSPWPRSIPAIMPTGVARENVNTSHLHNVKSSGKVFTREMPRAEAAAPL